MTEVSIIIVNWNTRDLLLNCVNAITKTKPKVPYEIIVVDNGSLDDSVEAVKSLKLKNLTVIENNENLGFSKANNKGIKVAKGKYILLLNSDTKVKSNAIDALYQFAENHPEAGVIGSRLLNKDGSLQESCFRSPSIFNAIRDYWFGEEGSLGNFGKYAPTGDTPEEVDVVVGASFLITPAALRKVGMLDEKYFFFWEDLDYCRGVKRNGLKVYYLPESEVVHYHGSTVRKVTIKSDAWKNLIPGSKKYHGIFMHYLINFILWSGQKFKNSLVPILIILLLFPVYFQLLKPGFFPMQDDLQAFRVHQMDKCFDDFQIPCRWVPDAGYQYGYPQFNYYPPLPYYVGAIFHRLGLQYIDSVKLLFILGYLLSAIAFYVFIKSFFGKWEAFVGSLLYSYIPYKAVEVYVRGALNEFWAQIFFPLILWAIYKLIKTGKTKYLVWMAISIAALLTTHLLMTIIFIPIALIWAIFWLIRERRNNLFKVGLGGVLGGSLAAFFVLPVMFERNFVHLESLLSGYFDYRQHFVNLYKMFLSMEWGYGSSGFPDEKLNLSLGIIHWFLGIIILAPLALYNLKKKKKFALLALGLVVLTLTTIFMMHMKSSFIWARLPFLWFMQFPWRFLAVAIFMLCTLCAFSLHFAGRFKYLVGIIAVIAAFGVYINFYVPKDWLYITDSEKFSGISWEKQLTISIFDYLPIYATLPPNIKAPLTPEILEGKAVFPYYKKGSNYHEGVVSADTNSLIRIPMYDFPGMEVLLDQQKVSYRNDECRGEDFCFGLITINVPKGEHKLVVQLTDTPVRKFGNLITIGALLAVLSISFNKSRVVKWLNAKVSS